MGWGGRWEGGSGWGTHVNPWLIHVSVWQKPLQYSKVISLQLIKIIGKKKRSYHLNVKIQNLTMVLDPLLNNNKKGKRENYLGGINLLTYM